MNKFLVYIFANKRNSTLYIGLTNDIEGEQQNINQKLTKFYI